MAEEDSFATMVDIQEADFPLFFDEDNGDANFIYCLDKMHIYLLNRNTI